MSLFDLIFSSVITKLGQTENSIVILGLPLSGVLVDSGGINVFIFKFDSLFFNDLAGLFFSLMTFVFRESTVVVLSTSMSKEMTTDRFNKTINGSYLYLNELKKKALLLFEEKKTLYHSKNRERQRLDQPCMKQGEEEAKSRESKTCFLIKIW
jgi:hypothetical protein